VVILGKVAVIEDRSQDFLAFTGPMLKLAGLEPPGGR
jgi:hypothetical protein